MLNLAISILFFFVLLEYLFEKLVDCIRSRFQWLITDKKDRSPHIDPAGLEKFLSDGFDPELGWVRKPNTSHAETGRFGKTEWHTNEIGSRFNPGHEHLPVKISCFGDSFTFCRQVNDDETWEFYLSQFSQTNVRNWGVGNHGIDQSYLRLIRENERYPSETVIVAVVPDTISRILSTWKHYYEYGNTFGFKPRFVLTENGLELLPNPIDEKDKFFKLYDYFSLLQKSDYFYVNKFMKEIIKFPYVFSVLKNPKRNLPLIFYNCIALLTGQHEAFAARAKQKIMDINLDWRLKLYNDPNAVELLVQIILKISEYCSSRGISLIVAFLPQKDDILHIRENHHFYLPVIERLSSVVPVIDLAPELLQIEDLEQYYSDDSIYGGHFSKYGNQLVAQRLWAMLLKDIHFKDDMKESGR